MYLKDDVYGSRRYFFLLWTIQKGHDQEAMKTPRLLMNEAPPCAESSHSNTTIELTALLIMTCQLTFKQL